MVASISGGEASLADVLPSCFAALGADGFHDSLGLGHPSRIVLFVVDGLGRANLDSARGYARFLSTCESVATLETVFPSTTASALASLVTGTQPNQHGILGYRIWSPERAELVNQLNGIDDREVLGGWLAAPSLVGATRVHGHTVTVIGHERYRSSAMTRMLYTDAQYLGVRGMSDAFTQLRAHLAAEAGGLILVYLSQLDECAHRFGVDSYQWLSLLEELDGEIRTFARECPSDTLALLTADHGIVDVPASSHIDFGLGPEMHGVTVIGGEPRCLQVYTDEDADLAHVRAAWEILAGEPSLVRSPEELESAVWYRPSAAAVTSRIPDLYVFAPHGSAWYDGREPTAAARSMVGQHGGLSYAERAIPLLRVR